MNTENINSLINLSKDKKNMLEEILRQTEKQTDLIINDKLDEMEILLEEKQKIMNEIDLLDMRFLEIYNDIKSTEKIDSIHHIDINKYSNLKELKNIVKSINSILDKISKLDKENTSKMKESLESVRSNIKNVKNGKKAYKGYNKNYGGSILIDEKK